MLLRYEYKDKKIVASRDKNCMAVFAPTVTLSSPLSTVCSMVERYSCTYLDTEQE